MPTVTVVGSRSGECLTGWEVNAQAQAFTGATGIVDAKYLGWTPGVPRVAPEAGGSLRVRAGSVVASFLSDGASQGLGVSQLLVGTTTKGRGMTTLGEALDLAVPGSAAPGSYTSTLTITLVGG